MYDLPLQITQLHRVAISEPQVTHPSRGEIQRRRTAQASQAHNQHTGPPQCLLPHNIEIRQQNLPAVSRQFGFSQHASNHQ